MATYFFDIPERLWMRLEPLIPKNKPNPQGGRPRNDDRMILTAILYRMRTGCHWKALPPQFGSKSTCHRRFQEWVDAGVFEAMHREMLKFYDRKKGIKLLWTAGDSAIVKAPKGGTILARAL